MDPISELITHPGLPGLMPLRSGTRLPPSLPSYLCFKSCLSLEAFLRESVSGAVGVLWGSWAGLHSPCVCGGACWSSCRVLWLATWHGIRQFSLLLQQANCVIKVYSRGWGDGLVLRSTYCAYRRSMFCYRHPYQMNVCIHHHHPFFSRAVYICVCMCIVYVFVCV